MAKQHLTQYYGQKKFSDNQRRLGDKLYETDIDMFLFNYINGDAEPVACFDAKHYNWNGDVSKSYFFQKNLCNKLKIPFFTAIYYLDNVCGCYGDCPGCKRIKHPIPMYNLILENSYAISKIKELYGGYKYWFSEVEYSKLQHRLVGAEQMCIRDRNKDCRENNAGYFLKLR